MERSRIIDFWYDCLQDTLRFRETQPKRPKWAAHTMHFDQFAGDYKQVLDSNIAVTGEDSSYFAEYKAKYLARMAGADFRGRLLDFGCGVGLLSGFLKKHLPRATVDGFDVSRESLSRVDPALLAQGRFTPEIGELASGYNLIVTANVMHHIPLAERAETMRTLSEFLAPEGQLAIFEHNPANPVTRWAVDRCPFDEDAVLLPAAETVARFKAAGLEVVRRDYIVFMPHMLAWLRPLEPALAWLPLGAQYVVVGGKRG
jgi:2-polyprenyl-3-methyl-5-hydroxy-6-metoxy-1,4-benzoquinol methylase